MLHRSNSRPRSSLPSSPRRPQETVVPQLTASHSVSPLTRQLSSSHSHTRHNGSNTTALFTGVASGSVRTVPTSPVVSTFGTEPLTENLAAPPVFPLMRASLSPSPACLDSPPSTLLSTQKPESTSPGSILTSTSSSRRKRDEESVLSAQQAQLLTPSLSATVLPKPPSRPCVCRTTGGAATVLPSSVSGDAVLSTSFSAKRPTSATRELLYSPRVPSSAASSGMSPRSQHLLHSEPSMSSSPAEFFSSGSSAAPSEKYVPTPIMAKSSAYEDDEKPRAPAFPVKGYRRSDHQICDDDDDDSKFSRVKAIVARMAQKRREASPETDHFAGLQYSPAVEHAKKFAKECWPTPQQMEELEANEDALSVMSDNTESTSLPGSAHAHPRATVAVSAATPSALADSSDDDDDEFFKVFLGDTTTAEKPTDRASATASAVPLSPPLALRTLPQVSRPTTPPKYKGRDGGNAESVNLNGSFRRADVDENVSNTLALMEQASSGLNTSRRGRPPAINFTV